MTEVHREERRRTWWLLFLMDRHLALCYNRPLALLESECQHLLLPMDDIAWQSGSQPHSHGLRLDGPQCSMLGVAEGRACGPPVRCSGGSLFEFFLPLMTITGHLIDLNQAKNVLDPMSEPGLPSVWQAEEQRISEGLDEYQESLDGLAPRPSSSSSSPPPTLAKGVPTDEGAASGHWPTSATTSTTTTSRSSPIASTITIGTSPTTSSTITTSHFPLHYVEERHFSETVRSYAQHVVSVVRILLCSKWDPVCLFEDADFFTSSEAFKSSMSHTLCATDWVASILEHDPDASFMPYFFGIQLLHGSLLLLLVAHRLTVDLGPRLTAACETVVRATEACFVTLPTDYQRQFRNIMRRAIALAKGRSGPRRGLGLSLGLAAPSAHPAWHPSDPDHDPVPDPESREMETQLASVLARYRWSRNGGGLARPGSE